MVLAMQLSYSARSAVLLFLTVAAPKDTCTDGIVARRFQSSGIQSPRDVEPWASATNMIAA
jgi:hypothetical protein